MVENSFVEELSVGKEEGVGEGSLREKEGIGSLGQRMEGCPTGRTAPTHGPTTIFSQREKS